MSKETYDAMLPVVEAISAADILNPNMPIDTFVQEAKNLKIWSASDQERLVKVGTPVEYFDELLLRADALAFSQSLWMKDQYSREEARQEWEQKEESAYELKNRLEHAFRFAFRSRPELLKKVQVIEEGSGHVDMLQDLSDLSVLGTANLPLLEAINFDTELLTQASTTSSEMGVLLAQVNGERQDNNSAKRTRDRFYTHLKHAVDEIRKAGKYVCWQEPDRLKGYKSRYHSG
ncbi:hypothetical protein [Reichenbachiella ulvae]|uniref:Uncharacterized protein n=1 Tax=Reichenbachiella ulvae TaxID=2980104 RepID=A0ABT3CNZ9_9BACT|nr:hypothetical protein [Reichenbachiella ulvae]MCV9385291.1 hypothetical protein [Reichenbachiella ulvae]